jgi:hypothetical protein
MAFVVIFVFLSLLCLFVLIVGVVMPSLLKYPKTGIIPGRGKIAATFSLLSIVFFVVALIVTPNDKPGSKEPAKKTAEAAASTPAKADADSKPASHDIKPETILTFPKGEIACLDRDVLKQAIEYGLSGKATKLNGLLLTEDNDDGKCLMLDPKTRFKVIDAEYNDPSMPDAAVLEVVGEDIESADKGAFVLVVDRENYHIVKAPTAR